MQIKKPAKNAGLVTFFRASISRSVIGKSEYPFSLSWTHYIQLLKIEDKKERDFYEIEAAQNNWSVRELMRQFNATCSAGHLT